MWPIERNHQLMRSFFNWSSQQIDSFFSIWLLGSQHSVVGFLSLARAKILIPRFVFIRSAINRVASNAFLQHPNKLGKNIRSSFRSRAKAVPVCKSADRLSSGSGRFSWIWNTFVYASRRIQTAFLSMLIVECNSSDSLGSSHSFYSNGRAKFL